MSQGTGNNANLKVVRRTLLVVVAMFGFGFALVPLYNVFCDITGLNGKASGRIAESALNSSEVDTSRWVTVEFISAVNQSLPWQFVSKTKKLRVHPGEPKTVMYYVHNRSERDIVGQAIPSVSPGLASKYFNKIECFCFSQQTLRAGEAKDMPVRFVVDPNLPEDINTVTLAYTFFDTGAQVVHNEQ